MRERLKLIVFGVLWHGALRRVRVHAPAVVAVTGGVGKTTTKEALAAILLQAKRQLLAASGSMNSESGVPLAVLGFAEAPQGTGWLVAMSRALFLPFRKFVEKPTYVLEYSADKPGDIAYLAKRIPPDIAVLTRIVPVHMQGYASFEDLVAEKFSLLSYRREGGIAVLNADDPIQVERGKKLTHVLWYGSEAVTESKPGVWAHTVRLTSRGISCELEFSSRRRGDSMARNSTMRREVQLKVIGRQQLSSLLAAATAALACRVDPEIICVALEQFEVPPGRGRVLEGRRGITIVDDSYNASPEAVKAGLDMVHEFAAERRVVAILGSMNELGETAEALHREVAMYAATRVKELVAVGRYGEAMRQAARDAGMALDHVIAFATPQTLISKLDQVVHKGDVVYVKASQNGMRLERVVERLLANPAEAPQVLTRQSMYWKGRP